MLFFPHGKAYKAYAETVYSLCFLHKTFFQKFYPFMVNNIWSIENFETVLSATITIFDSSLSSFVFVFVFVFFLKYKYFIIKKIKILFYSIRLCKIIKNCWKECKNRWKVASLPLLNLCNSHNSLHATSLTRLFIEHIKNWQMFFYANVKIQSILN